MRRNTRTHPTELQGKEGLLAISYCSCVAHKQVRLLIDQKDAFVWAGADSTRNYLLSVDKAEGIWFDGKIVINAKDTLYLHGFEKGNNHPTTVAKSEKYALDRSAIGYIFIWARGYTADTIYIDNSRDSIQQLPIGLSLFKKRKVN